MSQRTFFPKVALDMFVMQMVWSLFFLGIILTIHIGMIIVSVNTGDSMVDFLFFTHGSAKIYMLVIGIISTYGFLRHYAHHGITRKDYFTGSAIAAAGVALAIGVIAIALTGMEYVVMEMADIQGTLDRSLAGDAIQVGNNSISIEFPKAIFESSVLIQSSSWIVSLFMYSLNILTYYAAGWLIGSGFYRFGWFIGLGFILLSLLFIITGDLLWGTELGEPLSNWLPFDLISLPLYGSFLGTIIIIGIMLWLIRLATRNATIKM
ncbi:hypothetical protein [Lentibacillus amyloliquefaciens]|uniref:Uncharacterized protein n=1 Tax=Lentibacillus amyloliquefaciens TaxID=1472767 RepID=A0A0U4FEC0_9BACI|nr:hypothetical protein [Lentibacillus amyloliquefaciens]ALX48861.1 hypothetical protein AOX59_09685 [Lentibacillus amyloliquefaciens]